ncbi:MAG TPA: flagellar FliJ family protein [Bryobacteraceae bacterium]|jgi:flagellar export protein FliJ|nr:flagellar FliJ family protein [Bryobacteraceae bacterium]
MTPFRFPLDKVLDWRRLLMRAEEEKLAVLQSRLQQIRQRISLLVSTQQKSEWSYRNLPSVAGSDLHSLPAFQARVNRQRTVLELEQKKCETQIEAQRAQLLKARRDYRVLEKLKERRHRAWAYELDRELENTAADAYFSKLIQSRSEE